MLQEVSTALEHLRREEREAMGEENSSAMQHGYITYSIIGYNL